MKVSCCSASSTLEPEPKLHFTSILLCLSFFFQTVREIFAQVVSSSLCYSRLLSYLDIVSHFPQVLCQEKEEGNESLTPPNS